MDVLCFRPTPDLEARLRRAAAELGARVVVAALAGTYVSPVLPTVVVIGGDRILAHAVGDLPLWELRNLLAAALRSDEHTGRDRERPEA
jgi:hypothetical protein